MRRDVKVHKKELDFSDGNHSQSIRVLDKDSPLVAKKWWLSSDVSLWKRPAGTAGCGLLSTGALQRKSKAWDAV